MKNIAIIGLGYVGLPLLHAFSFKYKTAGYDINLSRINELKEGFDRTNELNSEQMKELLSNETILTVDSEDIRHCNVYIITVPTPIDEKNEPDLTPIIKSTEMVASVLNEGDIVIYESTVYPGVTEDICVPIIEDISKLKYNESFYCGYSPERINPGDKVHTVTNIVKVTSGSTPEIADQVDDLYKSIITAGTYKAESIKVAEAAKVIENTQRDVNIALVNELSMIFDLLDIDTNAVLNAADTKWNFNKFMPGLVGGHCIGVDPYYLTYKAQSLGYIPNLILDARQVNNGMSKIVAEKAVRFMISENKNLNGADVLFMGVTFKEDCPDMRNSKALDIIKYMEEYKCNVYVFDDWVDKSDRESKGLNFVDELPLGSEKFSSIIIATGHSAYSDITYEQFASMSKGTPIIIDVKGVTDCYSWKL